jgi:hypothetical protein
VRSRDWKRKKGMAKMRKKRSEKWKRRRKRREQESVRSQSQRESNKRESECRIADVLAVQEQLRGIVGLSLGSDVGSVGQRSCGGHSAEAKETQVEESRGLVA